MQKRTKLELLKEVNKLSKLLFEKNKTIEDLQKVVNDLIKDEKNLSRQLECLQSEIHEQRTKRIEDTKKMEAYKDNSSEAIARFLTYYNKMNNANN